MGAETNPHVGLKNQMEVEEMTQKEKFDLDKLGGDAVYASSAVEKIGKKDLEDSMGLDEMPGIGDLSEEARNLLTVTDDEISALTAQDLEAIRASKEERLKEAEKMAKEKEQKKNKEKLERMESRIDFLYWLFSFCLMMAGTTILGYSIIFRRYSVSDFHELLSDSQRKRLNKMPAKIQKKQDKKIQKRYMNEQIRNQERQDAREVDRAGGPLSIKGIAVGLKQGLKMFGKSKVYRRASYIQTVKFTIIGGIICWPFVVKFLYNDDSFTSFKISDIKNYITSSPIAMGVIAIICIYLIIWIVGILFSPIFLTNILRRSDEKLDAKAAEHNADVKNFEDNKGKSDINVKLDDLTREDKAEYILQKRSSET